MRPVNPDLVGELWPSARPFKDWSSYGRVDFSPTGEFEVRSLQTFKLVYTAGRYGIDDTGELKVVFRFVMDNGGLQTTDPTAPNYVTVHASNGVTLTPEYNQYGHLRPRDRALIVSISDGCLIAGDTITIIFGDTTGGSPGMLMQTFCESALEFKVLVDIYATGNFVPLPETPAVAIVPGPPVRWRAIGPTFRQPGEQFSLGLRADDKWGNPSDRVQTELYLKSNRSIENLPDRITFPRGQRSLQIGNLVAGEAGIYRVQVFNDRGDLLTEANPLVVQAGPLNSFWGDLHGQTGETVAINTAREYFTFARDLAFLDVTSHQGNDFQIKNAFWEQLNQLTAEFYQKHRFVTYPGYEWSGNTGIGGDHNVYYPREGRPLLRSSHALVDDMSDIDSDAPTLKDLFHDLADEDAVVYAHVGGRYADPGYAHDPKIETAMEIHSAWGTFEWLLTDGFEKGHRCGVVCNSDDHKCRPGASHPGAAHFGTFGGLTCFLTPELTRQAIFDCLRRRHHYGTSGNRLHLDVRARFDNPANLYESDPRVCAVQPRPATEIMMGDIAQSNDASADVCVRAVSHSPIERIEILNGKKTVRTLRGYGAEDLGKRIRVVWSGAKYRGRGRQVSWVGKLVLEGARITRFVPINLWNPERLLEQRGDNQVVWDTITTGNFVGFDVWLDETAGSRLTIDTNGVSETLPLEAIGFEDTVFDAGGLEQKVRLFRMPDTNPAHDLRDTVQVELISAGDNPLWVRVTTDDGYNAWSSPMFIYSRED